MSAPSVFAHAREGLATLAGVPLLRALAIGQLLAALSAGATSAPSSWCLRPIGWAAAAAWGCCSPASPSERSWGRSCCAGSRPILDARCGCSARTRSGPGRPRPLVTALPAAAAAVVFYGVSTSTGNVTFSSLIQSRVPEGCAVGPSPAST